MEKAQGMVLCGVEKEAAEKVGGRRNDEIRYVQKKHCISDVF